jgi:hypothetical protein
MEETYFGVKSSTSTPWEPFTPRIPEKKISNRGIEE